MYSPYPRWLRVSPLLICVSFMTPVVQAEEANSQLQSTVEVVNSTLTDVKIKRLGEPVKLQYVLKTPKKSASYDVYLAYSAANMTADGLLFIQAAGNFTKQPIPYYAGISGNTDETVLDLVLPNDLQYVGEHFFYAALIQAGTDLSNLAPLNWPWEKLSTDHVFVSR